MKRSVLELKVSDVMSRDPVTAGPEEEVSKVLGKMRKHDIHEVPIVEGRTLLGMVSYSTILKRRNLPMNTRVETILIRPPRVAEDDPVPQVAEILMSSGYRAVPVVRGGEMVGIVSRTDLVRAIARSAEAEKMRVSDIMTPDPQVVSEEDSILRAREVLRSLDERAVPVVDSDGRVVGVIGVKDLVKVLTRPREKATKGDVSGERTPMDVEIKSVMSTPPVSVEPEDAAAEAARLMEEYNISSVVVTDGGRPLGIVTQVDLLEQVAALKAREEVLVQISGLDEDDWWTYESLYTVIGRGLRRIRGLVRPTILNVHVVTHRSQGDRAKYSIGARLSTNRGLYVARDHDWDPFMAMQRVMNQLERRLKREKERRVNLRKGPR